MLRLPAAGCRLPAAAGRDASGLGALLHGGRDARLQAAGGGLVQAGAKRSLSPSLPSTRRNHRVDAPVPATTSATVAAVESIRNTLAGSATISTASPAASTKKIPAHSQVAPWKKRCRPG